ncbi:MAG TPA: GNAT family N-acetyltransferase [Streptosporangiaceae bacterium]|nr:GNAT family N-acetyltransferase [Streptosporangiaceae bacterium]
MAAEVEVRAFRAGDGEGCARAWLDAARYYVDRDPENFQLPAEAGLAEWFEQARAGDGPPVLRLVATVAGQVAGLVVATLEAPLPDARFQLVSAAAVVRVYVNALVVAGRYRRTGVGTALMKAVERWGREHGAALVALDTNIRSPLSVPFYEDRMGYLRHGVIFRKNLS